MWIRPSRGLGGCLVLGGEVGFRGDRFSFGSGIGESGLENQAGEGEVGVSGVVQCGMGK